MDRKISSIRESQQLIGDKINMLQESNKKSDDEADKIRELIAECRENLNRIKCDAMGSSTGSGTVKEQKSSIPSKSPCSPKSESRSEERSNFNKDSRMKSLQPCGTKALDLCSKYRNPDAGSGLRNRTSSCGSKQDDPCAKLRNLSASSGSRNTTSSCGSKPDDPCAKFRSSVASKGPCGSRPDDPCAKYRGDSFKGGSERCSEANVDDPCREPASKLESRLSALSDANEKSRQCIDKLGERMEREVKMKIHSSYFEGCEQPDLGGKLFDTSDCDDVPEDPCDASYQDRVSCRVDLNTMKVNLKGSPEDLKKLDAVQLINLLDKFQCQELVINTGCQSQEELREVPVFYLTHPGNLALLVGITMVAYLVTANLCSPKRGCRTKFLLNMLYLGSFAFHCGMVFWMSFIRGLTLSIGLTKDAFNTVDNLILPKYFSVCVFLSAITLYSFLATHCAAPCTSWPLNILVQVIIVSVTFLIELITVCYVVPAVIKLRTATRHVTSEDFECGPPGGILGKNLVKLAKLNWTICLINTITVIFMGSNMYYMSSKLNIG